MFQYIYKTTPFFEVVNSVNQSGFAAQRLFWQTPYTTGTLEQGDNERAKCLIHKAFLTIYFFGTNQNMLEQTQII
jgi:hypothetical protein